MTVDLATSSATTDGSSASDTLIGITSAAVTGINDTIIGGSGNDILSSGVRGKTPSLRAPARIHSSSSGFADTLIGNAAGSTLDGTNGAGTVADYEIDNVTVDLATGTGTVNGSGVSDTLLGITTAQASGTDDTLIGGSGTTTLLSDGGGNTLVAGSGQTVAAYNLDNVTIDLAAGTAAVNGSSAQDKLVGITNAIAGGTNDTLVAGSGDEDLFGGGGANTYAYASAGGNDVIEDGGQSSQAVFSDINSTGVAFAVSSQSANDLVITINSTGKTVTVKGQFDPSGSGQLQDFTFANGVILSAAEVSALAGVGSGSTPTVAVSIDSPLLDLASPTGTVTFAFSAAPTAFTLADTSVVGGTLSNLSGSGTNYTATFTAAAGADVGNASVSVSAGSWQANGNSGAGGSTSSFTVDTVTPTVAVAINSNDVNAAKPHLGS